MTGEVKDLVQIIRDNPGCVAEIDNDCWWLRKNDPTPDGFENWEWEKQDEWQKSQELVCSSDRIKRLKGNSYASEDCYGTAIFLALAEIVGIQVESV